MAPALILTCDPRRPLIDSALLQALRGVCVPMSEMILAEGIAHKFDLERLPDAAVMAAVKARLDGHPIDHNWLPDGPERRRLLIADMDSTIIVGESLDDLAAMIGIGDEIAAVTAQAMRGELDFEDALKARVDRLTGQPATLLDDLRQGIQLTSGAETLVRTMRANGSYCALVSGGFTAVTEYVAGLVGFDHHRGNVLNVADGKIAGTVRLPILGQDAKRTALITLCQQLNCAPMAALAVGDGANDLAMLTTAGLGVAFQAKPAVREAARFCIDHSDLTALLFLQGYKLSEFAT
jgi:phosphoserine phosphatase